MSDGILLITYQHSCRADLCSRYGQQITDRPTQTDGVAYPVRPVCVETGCELVEIKREVLPAS